MPKNPHADFSPVLDGYSGIGAFRFWCQTALPLTYDDSLSYYELLNKVVNYLNHTIEDLTAVESNTSALADAYNQLQKYVNDYFDELDVEAELRNVLDAMAEDGTLDALLDPIVENQLPGIVDEKIDSVVAEQIDGAVAGQIDESVADQLPALADAAIPEEVSDWLEENVDPVGSAVMVDSSLTISGAAADAKVTGGIKREVDNIAPGVRNFVAEWNVNHRIFTNAVGDIASPNTIDDEAGYACVLYPCRKNDKFKVTDIGTGGYRGAVLTDTEYEIYKLFGNSLNNYEIVAEKDGYIICNTINLSTPYSLIKLNTYDDVIEQFKHIGLYWESVFPVTAGTAHSATLDQTKVDIKTNEKYYVFVNGSIDRWQIYAYYEDGTNELLIADSNYIGIATKNIVAFGISASASWISQSGNVSLTAFTTESIYGKITDLDDRVDDLEIAVEPLSVTVPKLEDQADHIGWFYDGVIHLQRETTHNAGSEIIPVNFPANSNYYVFVSGDVKKYHIYAFYEGSAYEKKTQDIPFYGSSASDTIGIGIYVKDEWITADCNLYVKAFSAESLFGKTANTPLQKIINTARIGAELPANVNEWINGWNITATYVNEMKDTINEWMNYYMGDDMKIPFILHTDQHNQLYAFNRCIFTVLDYLVNWDSVSAIFNLGDTVLSHWENPLSRNEILENALKCLQDIPENKQINVYGNHDTWYKADPLEQYPTPLPSLKYLNPYFLSNGLITRKLPDNSGLEVIYDTSRNVKYLILAAWDYAENGVETEFKYQYYWINPDHLRWIVSEMEKNDGYDLILVSHVPLEMGGVGCVNPITGDPHVIQNPTYITHNTNYLLPLWNARKNKTNGVIKYKENTADEVDITYDFRNLTGNCLCALSGHTHYDGAQYLNNENSGLLCVAFDYFQVGHSIHFGIIDRENRIIKVWKLSNNNNVPTTATWNMSLDKQA